MDEHVERIRNIAKSIQCVQACYSDYFSLTDDMFRVYKDMLLKIVKYCITETEAVELVHILKKHGLQQAARVLSLYGAVPMIASVLIILLLEEIYGPVN